MVVGDSSQQLATLLQHRLVPLRLLPSLSSLLEDGASFCEKGCLAVVEDAHLALEQLALLQEETLLRDGVQQVFSELLDGGVGAGGGMEARVIGNCREVLQHLLAIDAGRSGAGSLSFFSQSDAQTKKWSDRVSFRPM